MKVFWEVTYLDSGTKVEDGVPVALGFDYPSIWEDLTLIFFKFQDASLFSAL